MTKAPFLAMLLLVAACAAMARGAGDPGKVKYPGGKAYMFRVGLRDKAGTPFSLDRPEEFLSEKSIRRRQRQGILPDSTDLPVSPAYLAGIASAGVEVVGKSKWNNTVLVRCRKQDAVRRVQELDFVTTVTKVWTSPDSVRQGRSRAKYHTEFNRWDTIASSRYGVTLEQVGMLGGVKLHDRGFTGEGMTIAVLDGGFMNADVIPCLHGIRFEGMADFVVPRSENMFKEMEHGTKVLSVMAVNEPDRFIGTAPDASYWLIRCEDEDTESLAEEDYWAEAAEFADSVGVDIISSSLGFHSFDDASANYAYWQLDGRTSMASRTASMLASKGIVLVNSAGNDGMSAWKKIGVPADADRIITVGAVAPNGRNAPFCSVGPTADGRVKPDVMALGSPTAVVTGRGTIIKDMGTSFATPVVAGLVACLWQALGTRTAAEIVDIVRASGDNAPHPDNIYGYGIPDFWKAYTRERKAKAAPNQASDD